MTEIAMYIGPLFGLFGVVIAFWQSRQKANLDKISRANSWFNYQRANNANGTVQLALELYKQKHQHDLDPDVLEQLSKADAFAQDVYKESIRLLRFSEKSFKYEDISKWEEEGKISEFAKPMFVQISDKSKKRTRSIKLSKIAGKLSAPAQQR